MPEALCNGELLEWTGQPQPGGNKGQRRASGQESDGITVCLGSARTRQSAPQPASTQVSSNAPQFAFLHQLGSGICPHRGRVFGNRLRREGAATAGPRCVADWAMQRAQWGGWDGRVGLRGLHTTRATARATEGGHLLARFRKLKRSLKFAPTPAAS